MVGPFDRSRRFPIAALSRNDLLAARERLAREECEAEGRLNKLRGELDDIANQLGGEAPGAPLRESERNPALWMVNQDRAHRGLPPLTELPPGPPQAKREKIDPAKLAKEIVRAGRRARGEKDD
jgi:hypothetical protein